MFYNATMETINDAAPSLYSALSPLESVEILELCARVARDLAMDVNGCRCAETSSEGGAVEETRASYGVGTHCAPPVWMAIIYVYLTIKSMLQKVYSFFASEELQPDDVADMYYKTSVQMFGGFH